jgi:hypothetical protein
MSHGDWLVELFFGALTVFIAVGFTILFVVLVLST